MRAVFGVVSLLVVLAIIGLAASRQLKSTQVAVMADQPGTSASATVREQSQQLQQKVANDVARSLQQGAARSESAEK